MLEDRGEELQALINVNPSQGLKHGGAGELHHEKSLSALATLLFKGYFTTSPFNKEIDTWMFLSSTTTSLPVLGSQLSF